LQRDESVCVGQVYKQELTFGPAFPSACLRSISLSKQDDLCLCIESNRDNKVFAAALERCTHTHIHTLRSRDSLEQAGSQLELGFGMGRTNADVDVCSIDGSCIRCHRLVAAFNDYSN